MALTKGGLIHSERMGGQNDGLSDTQRQRLLMALRSPDTVKGVTPSASQITDGDDVWTWLDASNSGAHMIRESGESLPSFRASDETVVFDESNSERASIITPGGEKNLTHFDHFYAGDFTYAKRFKFLGSSVGSYSAHFGTIETSNSYPGLAVGLTDDNGDAIFAGVGLGDGSYEWSTTKNVNLRTSKFNDFWIDQDIDGGPNGGPKVRVYFNGTVLFESEGYTLGSFGDTSQLVGVFGDNNFGNYANSAFQGFLIDTVPHVGQEAIDWISGKEYKV